MRISIYQSIDLSDLRSAQPYLHYNLYSYSSVAYFATVDKSTLFSSSFFLRLRLSWLPKNHNIIHT